MPTLGRFSQSPLAGSRLARQRPRSPPTTSCEERQRAKRRPSSFAVRLTTPQSPKANVNRAILRYCPFIVRYSCALNQSSPPPLSRTAATFDAGPSPFEPLLRVRPSDHPFRAYHLPTLPPSLTHQASYAFSVVGHHIAKHIEPFYLSSENVLRWPPASPHRGSAPGVEPVDP